MRQELTPSALSELASRIAQRTGLAGLTISPENVERAWQQTQQKAGSTEPADLERSLREGRVDWDALIDALTIRETYFFRHPEQFAELRRRVVPQLRELAHEHKVVRVWSAGCASGEEAYTLAMLFEEEGLSSQIDITATDISREALERGRTGEYRDWSLRSLDPAVLARHFSSARGTHTVHARLRRQIDWRQLNLAEPSYAAANGVGLGQFALIFCRNVLMFFDAATIARVAQRLWASLLPGGWLFLGPSDPNVAVHADFEVIMTAAGLVYRRPPLVRSRSSAPLTSFDEEQLARSEPPASLAPEAIHPAPTPEPAALAQEIRQACNAEGAEHALALCLSALKQHPASAELHHLHAVLLWELCRYTEAAAALRRVLFLEGDNAIAHFGLGTLLERQGAGDAARRAYQNVLVACEKHAPDAALPLGDGICAAGLRAAAAGGLERLKPSEPETP